MLKKVLAVATIAGAAAFATPASAEPVFCYTLDVQVNETVLAQAGCLPE